MFIPSKKSCETNLVLIIGKLVHQTKLIPSMDDVSPPISTTTNLPNLEYLIYSDTLKPLSKGNDSFKTYLYFSATAFEVTECRL